jgi:transcriptional antiterminator RfaH
MDLVTIELHWYAIYVRPRFERMVAGNMERKNIESFLPLQRIHGRASNRVKEIQVPFFPGYVFCRFDMTNSLPILTIPGVKAVVGVGKTPSPIDESVLMAIRSALVSGGVCEPCPFPASGQTVQVVRGAMTGVKGTITYVKNSYRLIIPVQLLRRAIAVEIDSDCFQPAESPLGRQVDSRRLAHTDLNP